MSRLGERREKVRGMMLRNVIIAFLLLWSYPEIKLLPLFWLHFCTVGESRDASSIFFCVEHTLTHIQTHTQTTSKLSAVLINYLTDM